MKCPVCSLVDSKCSKKLFDDRYGYVGEFQLKTCLHCSHSFLAGVFTPQMLIKLYTDYYPRSTFDLEKFQSLREVKGLKSWLNGERRSAYSWVPKGARILDIGCGFGESLGYHKQRGCDVYGVEADENILRVAERFGFKVHAGLFDPELYEPEYFDYVTLDQVIEHVVNPLETMRGVAKILKPGGVVILSTPNANGWGARVFGRHWISWHAPYHLQHFSRQSMQLTAEKSGLKICKVKTITSSEWLLYQWIHLLTFPRQGDKSSFWSPQTQRGMKGKIILALCKTIHWTKINHLMTRFFDAVGLGDNYLFILRKQ